MGSPEASLESMQIHLIQTDIRWEQKESNFQFARSILEKIGPREGSLLLFPEMFATGFSMDADKVVEPDASSPVAAAVSGLARQTKCWIVAGIATASS